MANSFDDIWYTESEVTQLQNELAIEKAQSTYYKEAYSDSARALLAAEDVGWQKLGVSSSFRQIDLTQAKQLAERIGNYCDSNPLLTRGREIRNSYLFNAPYEIGTEGAESKITPQQRNNIDRAKNQRAVFSMEALERLEGERYAAGQVFVLFDRVNKDFQHISFQEIADIIYNPDDSNEIWYVAREWDALVVREDGSTQQVTRHEYYPASDYIPATRFARRIKDKPVDVSKRMIVDRVNVRAGGNLGVPDAFAATPWALAYSAYLSDGSKVLAALAEWVWLVKPKKRPAAETAAASVRSERGVAGTLFTDADVQSLPNRNAIDLETGRPLAAQVASALGISLVVLLADPSQGGGYNVAASLSDPNRRTMEARRERNTDFLVHCLKLLGIKDPAITWQKMSPGTDGEETDIVMKAWGSGQFHVDEIRPRLAELGHIQLLHEDAPDGILIPNNEASLPRADIDADGSSVSDDGSTSMSNGQGRDSLGIGKISKQPKADGQRGTASQRANT